MKQSDSFPPSGSAVRSVALNAVYLVGGRGLTNAVRFGYMIILARELGPELYGLFNYGMSWYLALIPVAGLGLGIILSREVGRDRTNGNRVVSQTLLVRIGVTVAVAAVSILAACLWENDPQVRVLLIVFSLAMVGRSLSTWCDQVFTAYEVNKYSLLQQALFRPSEVVLGLLTLLAGGGLVAVTVVHAVTWWLQGGWGMIWVYRKTEPIRMENVRRGLGGILFQGMHVGLGLFMMNWLQQGSVVLFRHMATEEGSLGQLALAMQVFTVLYYLPVAAGTAAFPVLSRAVARRDGKDLLFAQTMLRGSLILGAAAGMVGVAAGPWLTKIFFGSLYQDAGRLAGFAVWLLIPWAWGDTLYRLYLAREKFFLPMVCAGVGAAVLTLSMAWLVPAYGARGAVLATGLGMGTWALILAAMLASAGELDLIRMTFRPSAAILMGLGVYYALKPAGVWVALPTSLFVLGGGTLLLRVVSHDEWSAFRDFARKRILGPGVTRGPADPAAEEEFR